MTFNKMPNPRTEPEKFKRWCSTESDREIAEEAKLRGLGGPSYSIKDGRTVDTYTGEELEL